MKPILFVQNNFVERVTGPAANAARSLGWDIVDASLMPEQSLPEVDLPCDRPIFAYGSIQWVTQCRDHPVVGPWVSWDETRITATRWATELGRHYLNGTGEAMTVEAFKAQAGPPRHCRPIGMVKALIGGLYTAETMARVQVDRPVTDEFEIWVAPNREIAAEVRVWFVDGRVVAASMYRCDNTWSRQIDHPLIAPAIRAAVGLSTIFLPMPQVVMDVALVEGEWLVVEFNPIHTSGWYAADPTLVLQAFETMSKLTN